MEICCLCNSSERDELRFGEFMVLEGVAVHYFCLLLAPGLYTKGAEDEGILGFLVDDIRKESSRVKRLRCKYCRKISANLGCNNQRCQQVYHYQCGFEFGCAYEFHGQYPTFCAKHSKFKQKQRSKPSDTCGICSDQLKTTVRPILAPCCKNSWFHRECLQKCATTSGVFFKCPLCNNKDEIFITSIKRLGIFVPEKDADWELVQDMTFSDQRKICVKCNEEGIVSYAEFPWLWKSCFCCGGSAAHVKCLDVPENANYVCVSCDEVLKRPKEIVSPKPPQNQRSPIKPSRILKEINKEPCMPKVKKKKFTPWFSDDEQVSSESEDEKELIVIKRRLITPKKGSQASSSKC